MKKRSPKNMNMTMPKNKKVLWYILVVILVLGAFALGRDTGMRDGTANTLEALMPTDYIYPPTDGATAPIYPPTDYIYPPTDGGTAPIYPPTTDYIYPPTDGATAPIYPPTDPLIYPPY